MSKLNLDHDNTFSFGSEQASKAWELIKSSNKIILLPHENADADAVSSCAALADFLAAEGKTVETVYVDKVRDKVEFRPRNESIGSHSFLPDLVISLDVANKERLYWPSQFDGVPFIVIDHHHSNSLNGVVNLVDSTASSTCEILSFLMNSWNQSSITLFANKAMLFGILVDSQIFRIQLASLRTIKISAAIIENGVDYQEIKELARNYRAPFVVRTWASFLSQLRTISGKSTTLVTASISELEAIKAEPSTMSGFINFISDLVSSDIVIFLLEKKPGIIRGSLRSKTTDISKIANQFNGGGHKNASGFTFTGTIAEAEEAILKLL